MKDWTHDILTFWFEELGPEQWWGGSEELDESIRDRFEELWEEQRGKVAADFLNSPREALAAVILFDQLPRNMYRGTADMFATDHLALQIARGAVDSDLDAEMNKQERQFLYMPFMHSEDRDDQNRSLLLFARLDDADVMDFAQKHHDIVDRFGRFPHRNVILGRDMRDGEAEAVEQGAEWMG